MCQKCDSRSSRSPTASRRAYRGGMPKKPRSELAPGLVHVTARGNRRVDIITAERDVRSFEDFLEDSVRRSGVTCHAVCLMPNHVHLVFDVETIKALSDTMQRLNGRYAQWFNLTYGFNGHLFQGPYGAVAAQSESHALELIRYVLLNPARATVVLMAYGSPERLADVPAYYADIRGGRPIRPELLADLTERYRRLGIEDSNPLNAITEETRAALQQELELPVFTGMKHWTP